MYPNNRYIDQIAALINHRTSLSSFIGMVSKRDTGGLEEVITEVEVDIYAYRVCIHMQWTQGWVHFIHTVIEELQLFLILNT